MRICWGWDQLNRPSRPFLTVLAAAGFVGALLLTPPVRVRSQPAGVGIVSELGPGTARNRPAPSIDSTTWEKEVVARYDHLPLAQILTRTAESPEIANRVARAIIKESRELQLSPSLLAGVLLTENSRLEPETVSHRGAIGLMQVMRFHAGVYDCDSDDLLQIEANICHGARVFASYLKRTRDVRSALLRYNGCVRGRATQSCRRYPTKVLQQAQQVRHQLLLYLPRQKLSSYISSPES